MLRRFIPNRLGSLRGSIAKIIFMDFDIFSPLCAIFFLINELTFLIMKVFTDFVKKPDFSKPKYSRF